jgi:hypothetical protein
MSSILREEREGWASRPLVAAEVEARHPVSICVQKIFQTEPNPQQA